MSDLSRRTFVILLAAASAGTAQSASPGADDEPEENVAAGFGDGGYGLGGFGGVLTDVLVDEFQELEVGDAIEVPDVAIAQDEVAPGEPVEVTGTVVNTSDREVSRTVVLVLDRGSLGTEVVVSEEVTLAPDERYDVVGDVEIPDEAPDTTYDIQFSHVEHDEESGEIRAILEADVAVDDDIAEDIVDDLPGMGVPTAIAALGGAAYLFDRRRIGSEVARCPNGGGDDHRTSGVEGLERRSEDAGDSERRGSQERVDVDRDDEP